MKKNVLDKVMLLAMMAAMCVTFTACGGDSDGSLPGLRQLTEPREGVHVRL